jgi:hypothetical protein
MLETAGHKKITLRMVIMIKFFGTLLWARRDEVPNFKSYLNNGHKNLFPKVK